MDTIVYLGIFVITLVLCIAYACCGSALTMPSMFISSRHNATCLYPSYAEMEQKILIAPYFARMSKPDLFARGADSINGYINKYITNLLVFTDKEKRILRSLAGECDVILSHYPNITALPWKFAKVSLHIELGWPHTIGDTIVLSDSYFTDSVTQMLITMIHEKIHVYQRAYPEYTKRCILQYMPYRIYSKRSIIPLLANNPDLDDYVYLYKDIPVYSGYSSRYPKNISHVYLYTIPKDATTSYMMIPRSDIDLDEAIRQVDHPYEVMAEYIAYILLGKLENADMAEWMTTYL